MVSITPKILGQVISSTLTIYGGLDMKPLYKAPVGVQTQLKIFATIATSRLEIHHLDSYIYIHIFPRGGDINNSNFFRDAVEIYRGFITNDEVFSIDGICLSDEWSIWVGVMSGPYVTFTATGIEFNNSQ